MFRTEFDLKTKIFVTTISMSIIPIILLSVRSFNLSQIFDLFFWIVLIAILEYNPIHIFTHDDQQGFISITSAYMIVAIIVLGTETAVIVTVIGLTISELFARTSLIKLLFNLGQYGLTVYISGWLFYFLKQSPARTIFEVTSDWYALLVLVLCQFAVNWTLVSLVISLTTKSSFLKVFLHDIRMTILHHATSSTIGLAMVTIYRPTHPYLVLLFIPPLFLIDQAFRWYYALHKAATDTIIALANIVDSRDKYTSEHSSRVAEYSAMIASYMGLHSDEVSNIEIAASVHDLGKIGIADSIINKPDRLSDEEYLIVKKHPEIAFDLIKALKPYEKSSHYVYYHHEWVNGKGYPAGLADNSIPLGAKIVSVADAFDAMTTKRPYRRAYTNDEALQELERCAGTQFDKAVVEALIAALNEKNNTEEIVPA